MMGASGPAGISTCDRIDVSEWEGVLHELYPRAERTHVKAFAQRANELFDRFEIQASPFRLHCFLAQVGHESGGLAITEENLSYRAERICEVWPKRFPSLNEARVCERDPKRLANTVYCGRMGNGPPESGDGWSFRGRGYIQITGRDGYAQVGRIAGLDLVGNPDLAADPNYALLVACAFWRWKDLNRLCDADDFERVTRRINGGTTGMADRRAWLDKVRRTFAAPPKIEDQPNTAEVIAVQRALQSKGFREIGAADGIVGRRTIAVITSFRKQQGLPPGLIDAALKQKLDLVP